MIYDLLASDHLRLDAALTKAFLDPEHIDLKFYEDFRGGLLRHIAIEEKILFPALREAKDPKVEILLKRLHADHAAISAALVLSPTYEYVKRIEQLLIPHNRIEEEANGLYELCDQLIPPTRDRLLSEANAYPEVKIKSYNDTEVARRNAEKMFEEALKVGRLPA